MTTITTQPGELVAGFVGAALHGDAERARRVGLGELDRVGPVPTIEGLLAPALRSAGELWLSGGVASHGEHRVTAAVETVLQDLELRLPVPAPGPEVAVSTGDDDWHATGARLAGLLLRARGWRTRFVGPALTAARLDDLLRLGGVDVLALSCASPSRLAGVGRTVLAAHARGLPAVVGGSAFDGDPRRAARLGADAGPGSLPATGAQLAAWLEQWRLVGATRPSPAAHAALDLDPGVLLQAVVDRLDTDGPFGSRQVQQDVVRTTVDTWISAVAMDDPGLVRDQLAWVRSYLAARSLPRGLVAQLAGALRRNVPIDLGRHLERTAAG